MSNASLACRDFRAPPRQGVAWAVGALACASACGVTGESGPDPSRLERSVWVAAASGAEIVLEDGATLSVPAGALAVDADVTLSRETCGGVFASSHFRSCLYQVKGTPALTRPFSLQIPRIADDEGGESCVSRQGAEGWPCLADETSSADSPIAQANVFSFFAARAQPTIVVDGRVADMPFERCGGAIEGRWSLVATTATANRFYHYWRDPDPFAACSASERYEDRPFSSTHTLEFQPPAEPQAPGEEGLGRVTSSEGRSVYLHTITTMSCLRRVGERCEEGCVRDGDLCECISPQSVRGAIWFSSTWSQPSPGMLQFGSEPQRYCVEGDRLTIEFMEEIDGPYVQVYQRQP